MGYFGGLVAYLRTTDRLSLRWMHAVNGVAGAGVGIFIASTIGTGWFIGTFLALTVTTWLSLTLGALAGWGTKLRLPE